MDDRLSPSANALVGALVGVTRAMNGGFAEPTENTYPILLEGLAALGSADDAALDRLAHRARLDKAVLAPDCTLCASPCGRTADYDMTELETDPPPLREKKEALLAALQALAGAGKDPNEVGELLCEGLFLLGYARDPALLDPTLEKLIRAR